MFEKFTKTINSLKFAINFNKEIPNKFVHKVMGNNKYNAMHIAEQIKLTVNTDIKVTKLNTAEVGIAIIGTSIGLLYRGSLLMSNSQVKKLEKAIIETIKKDFGLKKKEADIIVKGIGQYKSAVDESWKLKTNPMNRGAGILLMHFAQSNIDAIFLKDNPKELNPLLHMMAMDQLILMVTEALRFFKE